MGLEFYELMTADWLEANTIGGIDNDEQVEDEELQVDADARYGRLISVDLNHPTFNSNDDITIKVVAAFEHRRSGSDFSAAGSTAEQGQVSGSINVMIAEKPSSGGRRSRRRRSRASASRRAMGFQLEGDLAKYATSGPYRGVEGESGSGALRVPQIAEADPEEPHTVTQQRYPELFEMWLKPQDGWGACYSAVENGHMHTVEYNRPIGVANGFRLELYGLEEDDTYNINYIEVSIYKDD